MTKEYEKLLSAKRIRNSTKPNKTLTSESESDRARLIFSAPFRRLQQKAQVFSLEENAAVRSRLTHSIEVAQIGRFIASQISENLISQDLLDATSARAFVNFVEVACLMHDLGNPPFGHFGEAAIANWFKKNGEACGLAATKPDLNLQPPEVAILPIKEALADFIEFDGNCQGLRIAALLQWNTDQYGLNLTFTSLASYLKYLRAPLVDSTKTINLPFRRKAGFFSTEKELVNKIWQHFNYSIDDPQRFPLAYIMEAADDIAYCISDIEDAIEKELLQINHVFDDLNNIWKEKIVFNSINLEDENTNDISNLFEKAANSSGTDSVTFTGFRTTLSTLLTGVACKTYCTQHDAILSGACTGLIPESSSGGQALKILKDYCRKNVYQHAIVQGPELVGFTAINGLLDHFKVLLNCTKKRFQAALENQKEDHLGASFLIEKNFFLFSLISIKKPINTP